jgi:Endonuclease/Exonuclease/phosphatase family
MRSTFLITIDSFIWTLVMMSCSLSPSLTDRPDRYADWKEKGFAAVYMAASRLTDPISCAHQLYRQVLVVDTLYPTASRFERGVRKSALLLGSSVYSFCSLFTTLVGIELRLLALSLQDKPYLYFRGDAEEKRLTERSISLLSWNLCCVSGGYSITDGGVLPWPYRMHQLASAVRSQDADVACLYEIFDIQTALRLIDKLKDSYTHFYFNIGPNAIGLSSGLFVASKVKIVAPAFTLFPQEAVAGRAKHCKKGFFSFDIQQEDKSFARIFSTHLQHSEVPQNPTQGEIKARKQAMALILEHMQWVGGKTCVLTGDLNLSESEYHCSDWIANFDKGKIQSPGFTWGGDQFCATLAGKAISSPLNLDHTMVMKSGCVTLTTSYVETGFDGTTFKPEAISDHKGLLSIMTFGSSN